jgi:prepilin-type N-terminal cleavage/methylation domain-containing protein
MHLFFKKSKGFTLIELLVVVSIIGLLSSIILVAIGPSRARSRDAKRQVDLKQVQSAMEMCLGDPACGGPNTYMTSTEPVLGYGTLLSIDSDTGPYFLKPLPKDPSSKGAASIYNYFWVSNISFGKPWYCIYARLEAPANLTYFCISNKGIGQKVYAIGFPGQTDCCGFDTGL